MSHLKERHEKICLNCQSALYGRYCHVCGQENLEPKETVWHLVTHFFNDITHFDGKFFSTVKYLLRKPGFLSAEYMAGRRASYLNPIRMYVFTSAIFFLILFALKKPDSVVHATDSSSGGKGKGVSEYINEAVDKRTKSLPELEAKVVRLDSNLAGETDADTKRELKNAISHLNTEIQSIRKLYGDTTTRKFSKAELFELEDKEVDAESVRRGGASSRNIYNMFDWGMKYKTVEAYDSAQNAMPDSLRDGWLQRPLVRRIITANEEAHKDGRKYAEHLFENFFHSFPKILFFSLPFFALILNVLYFRRKKTYYYVDHGIFTIHLYCATFILILILLLLNQLSSMIGIKWVGVIVVLLDVALVLYMFIYLYKAMRTFYKQGRVKTIMKYCLLCLLSFIVNIILMVIFFLISAISV